jgi:Tol biopolymer transport system component
MSLPSGTRLGPYEIVSLIGTGGMGEVYRARDSRLHRFVAIKTISPRVLGDAHARERFEREARAIASLSHSHICTLHDVGSAEGVEYLVMEHLEGETLSARLVRQGTGHPVPLDETLRIATELADALAAAHRAGIVHRDLKPANIMLTRAGGSRHGPTLVKVLDFGLAKLRESHEPHDDSITESAPLTGEGTFVGTLPYMAPEQLEGRDVDARTDLFAFGAIVYEMATGRRAFSGDSKASLVAAILDRDPAPLIALQPLAPPGLDRLIRKCLAKSPDARWQSASDIADELRWIASGSGSGSGPTVVGVAAARRRRRATAWLVLLTVLALAAAAGLWRWTSVRRSVPGDVRHTQVTFTGDVSLGAIAPDGRTIAYAVGEQESAVRVVVRDLAAGQALPIWTGKRITNLAWLSDGAHVAVSGVTETETSGIWIVPRLGGSERRIAASPDGAALLRAWQDSPGFDVLSLADGAVRTVKLKGFRWLNGVSWHPRTNHVLLLTEDHDGMSDIWRVTPDGQDFVRLLHSQDPVRAICASSTSAVLYGLRQRGPTGDLIRVSLSGGATGEDVLLSGLPVGETSLGASCTVTADGRRLLYLRGTNSSNLWRLDASGKSPAAQLTRGTIQLAFPDVSPDGQWIVATAGSEPAGDIVKIPIDGGEPVRLTEGIGAVWSPDGRRLAFVSKRGGPPSVWLVTPDGVRVEEVKDSAVGNPLLAWLPDGRLAWQTPDARNYRIRDLKTGREERLVENESVGWVFQPRYSAAGTEVVVDWNRRVNGAPGLWVMTWPGREARQIGPLLQPIGWSADGQWIYAAPRSGRALVRVSPRTGTSEPVGAFPLGSLGQPGQGGCALAPDRTSIICSLIEQTSDAWLVLDFDPELRP